MDRLSTFTTEDGLKLNYKNWVAPGNGPCVIYLHGLESHMGWFANLAEYLNNEGMNVYAFDRRGSGSNKENCSNFRARYLTNDLKIFVDLVRKEHPARPIFLIGLCLGGKIAVSFFASYPDSVDGLILISPSLKNKLRFKLPEKLSMLFNPSRPLKIPIEDRMFTANRYFLDYIGKDPSRLRLIPGGRLLEIAKMDATLARATKNIRIPVLLMLAGIDEIIDTTLTEAWLGSVSSKDKTLKVYDGLHHILTFEEKAGPVMQDIAGWIGSRIDAKSIAR